MRQLRYRRCLFALVAALIAIVAILTSGCGGAAETATSASASVSAASSTTTSASGSATASPSAALSVTSKLLVVRKQGASWRLVRLTPTTGATEVLGTLPFRPWRALSSPHRSRVLYVSERKLAVVEVASGIVRRISVDGGVHGVDGATWISDDEFIFGGGKYSGWPEGSSLYKADATSGAVSPFRGLKGGEPSYAPGDGSLVFVTSRVLAKAPEPYVASSGPWRSETIWRLSSLEAKRPKALTGGLEYIDAGRIYNEPLLSPDGRYILSPQTGTDVSITYSLLQVDLFGMAFLESSGESPTAAAWGGDKVAFQQSPVGTKTRGPAVFVYDVHRGSLAQYPCVGFMQLDWSPDGDLVGGAWQHHGKVFASAASDLGAWVDLGPGLVPVWIR